jgi:hypothetical protein
LTYEYDGQNRTTRQNRTLIRPRLPTSRHLNPTSITRTSAQRDTARTQEAAPDNPGTRETIITALSRVFHLAERNGAS